jgi:hypothetical protein
MLRRLLAFSSIALLAACGDDPTNPFNRFTSARPPSSDAVLLFVSGSWSATPGAPRELLALSADGTKVEQLTACAGSSQPCDFVQVAPSPDRSRVAAIRTTPGAEQGATALYFMDLARAVETIIFPRRRIDSVDWSADGQFIMYSSVVAQTAEEDVYYALPNGTEEVNLTETLQVRELFARFDPFLRTAAFERIAADGVSRIYLLQGTALTSGPAGGDLLEGTPYVVGADASPAFSPDGGSVVFRRLTGTGNGGLGTWDVLTLRGDGTSTPVVLASGPLHRGAPDWGPSGILFVETDAASSRSDLVLVQPDGSRRTVLRTEDAGHRMGSPRWLPPATTSP